MKHYTNKICLLVFLCMSASYSFSQNCEPLTLADITIPGTYNVGALTEADGLRDGPDYAGATVYYPINAAPPFAGMVIVPGFLSAESTIQNWGPFLASHGIVTMTIGTNSLFDQPVNRKDALLDTMVSLSEENTRTDSPLNGNLDTDRIAVGGWSMGGGGAQLAAVADPSIKAVMALCPWLDNTQLTSADLNHAVPLLIFSAEQDGIAPVTAHADVHYDYTPATTNKLIYEIDDAGHSVANDPTVGEYYIGQIAISWLQQYLIGDNCFCPLYLDTPTTASKYLTTVVCPEVSTAVETLSIENNLLYPNPSKESIHLAVKKVGPQTKYEIISLAGAKMLSGAILNQTTTINIQSLPAGVYLLNLIGAKTSETLKFSVL